MSKNHDKINNPEEVRNDDIEINDVEANPEEVDAEAAKEMAQEELTKEEALERACRHKGSARKGEKEYLFLMAEFDNFRKRTLKEKSELIKNGGENAMREYSPLLTTLSVMYRPRLICIAETVSCRSVLFCR